MSAAQAFEKPSIGQQAHAAPSIFKTERQDWTCFRDLNQLPARSGVQRHDLPALCAKELLDNAYDAGATRASAVALHGGGFCVSDDGPGIPLEEVPRLFSIARPMVSSKHLRMPTRGALGNGLRVVVGCVDASGGELIVETRGRRLRVLPQADGTSRVEDLGPSTRAGTQVEVRLGPKIGNEGWSRWVSRIREFATGGEVYDGASSPHWYDADAFYELCASAPGETIRALVARLEGCTGAKAGRITDGFQNRPCASLSRGEAATVLARAKAVAKPVKPAAIGRVGERGRFCARRTGQLAGGIPFCVEAWAEPVEEHSHVFVHVNRTAAVRDLSAQRAEGTLYLSGCGLDGDVLERVGKQDFEVTLHVTTAWMPIVDQGKVPNLGHPDLRAAVLEVIASAARKANLASPGTRDLDLASPRDESKKDVVLDVLDAEVEALSEGGKYRFNLRNLFYRVRPHVQERLGRELGYDYFARIIGDHEERTGEDIPGIYRDPRGTLYHPHTRAEIPVGTLNVEAYARPAFTFNKLLFVEKEGLCENLKAVGWPERHDCALLSTKGFSTKAARDLLDFLGKTEEPLTIFCIHDADGPGTMIFQTLCEETAARGARNVKVINLGLELDEALAMGLNVERVTYDQRVPCARYVDAATAERYQRERVELNEMKPARFLAWLDDKLAARDAGKVVPPSRVILAHMREHAREELRARMLEALLREVGFEARLKVAFAPVAARLEERVDDVVADVADALEDSPASRWADVAADLADEILGDEPANDGDAQ